MIQFLLYSRRYHQRANLQTSCDPLGLWGRSDDVQMTGSAHAPQHTTFCGEDTTILWYNMTMDELLLTPEQLGEPVQTWLAAIPAEAFVLAVERLPDGRVLLRPFPDASPDLIAQLRVTMAKYHETLMNLT